ncbi:MAG: S-layer homology domain-containing protein [Armatimonadetes bacterium]|nr:S-layer homology domain-containing protein [Armatimonadota bacterium]
MKRVAWLVAPVLAVVAAHGAPEPTPVAVAGRQVRTGLQVRALVDKPRAVPDDVVTLTLLCRNLGPGDERAVTVAQPLPTGLEPVPQAFSPGVRYEAAQRRFVWQLTSLAADQETGVSVQARVATTLEGTTLSATPEVRSAGMGEPRLGQPAGTEVVSVPLLAAFAVPDVMIASAALPKPLIDLGAEPGQELYERLIGLGVVSGFPDGAFRPGAAVTRAQATKMIVATQQLAGLRDRVNLSLLLRRPADVNVTLYSPGNRPVRALAKAWALPAGTHQLIWDGRDDAGSPVPLGVYRYEIKVSDEQRVEQTLDGTVNVVTVTPLPRDLVSKFRDVKADAWYQPYVAAAEERGIVKGYPGRRFEPSAPISRVENTVMVVRAAGLAEQAQARMNEVLGFDDAQDVPRWAIGYVAVATSGSADGQGRMFAVGFGENRFQPTQTLTRGEAASVLERLLDRDTPVEVLASGRIARGHQVTLNGLALAAGDSGRFRRGVLVAPGAPTLNITAQ